MKHKNLWAPWRIEYLKSLNDSEKSQEGAPPGGNEKKSGCFLCDYRGAPLNDRQNLVLWRTSRASVVMNRYPYTAGHLLITPAEHVPDLACLDEATLLDMMKLSRDTQKIIAETIHPHGFNIGINIGRCSGAGLPGHVHMHVVPRWDGDTNFVHVTAQVRVISQSLEELYDQLSQTAKSLGLPEDME
ncbi:MAG: HIT domain-containing protein [Phycisphaerae bacterium]|nr:HIT domain-containing protein [Phycisphaerae bacterium]